MSIMEGYDAKFDPPLEKRLECPICLLAQREPMQTPCGHRFCSMCILRALRETGPRCPVDNTRVSHQQLFKDNFAKREVLSLNVRCSAEEFGCKWSGELRDLDHHIRICELVTIDCHNCCGHNCHRKDLTTHLPLCPNKPRQCPSCGIHFVKDKFGEHDEYCSNIMLPDSVLSSLFKAGDVLKWIGTLKMKSQSSPSQPIQVTAYLTAKSESDESYIFTGNWSSSLNIMTLNLAASRIFWRMLRGPEVQPKFFDFRLLSTNDPRTINFSRMLKRKNSDHSAAVCLHLKPGPNRPDLTIIYFHWNEQKKKLMACVAELKSHLVRQIQSRLQILQQTSRRGRSGNHDSQSSSRDPGQQTYPHLHRSHPHNHPHSHPPHPSHPHNVMRPPAAPTHHIMRHPHNPNNFQHVAHHPHHPHPHIAHPHPSHPHPSHPTAVAVVTHPDPHQAQHHPAAVGHSVAAAQGGPGGLSNLLSWRMSQSLNPIPWRMQPGTGVPFFTFPSTPPQFLPANPYPYTFAPLPAPPFSINPIPPGVPTSAVPVPSYAGIAVPQVTTVEPIAGQTFPVALADPTEGLPSIPAGAVAVTLSGTNQAVNQGQNNTAMAVGINSINVIQQPVIQQAGPSQSDMIGPSNRNDMAVIHTLQHTVHPQHFQPSQIPAQITPATLIQTENGSTVAVVSSRTTNPVNQSEHFNAPVVAVQVPAVPGAAGTTGLIPVDPQNGGNIINVHMNSTVPPPPHPPPPAGALAHPPHPSQPQSQQQSVATSSSREVQSINDDTSTFGSSFPLSPYPVSSSPSSTSSSPTQSPTSSGNATFPATNSINLVSPTESDTSDSVNSPQNFSSVFYNTDNFSPFDSDADTPPPNMNRSILYEGRDLSSNLSSSTEDESSSSDQEESPGRPDSAVESQTSALHTLANAATSVIRAEGNLMGTSSRVSSDESSVHVGGNGPMRLPVLINISDSETESHVSTPTSVIDLTNSPITSSPSVSIETSSATPPTPVRPSQQQLINQALQDTVRSLAPAVVVEHEDVSQPLLVPVIQQRGTQVGGVEMSGQSVTGHAPHHHQQLGNGVAIETNRGSRSRRVLNFNTHQNLSSNHHIQETVDPAQQQPSQPHIQANPFGYTDYPPHNQPPPPGPLGAPNVLNIAATPAVLSADGSLAPNPVVSLARRNLHVLGWQPAYDQQHHHPHQGEGSHQHQHHMAVPGHVSSQTAYHTRQSAGGSGNGTASGGTRMQGPVGNFWETVMPSLDMSMQNTTNEVE